MGNRAVSINVLDVLSSWFHRRQPTYGDWVSVPQSRWDLKTGPQHGWISKPKRGLLA